ncbi:MAG: DUF58 domain-containing protein [Ruminococcus sp.]|nr:DUF58 domain-containing protein [Ruminococcus sp.]
MTSVKFMFIFLIVISAAFYVLYVWDFSLVLLIVVIALPVLMFIMTLITKKLITVSLNVKETTAAKNELFDIQLSISNRSIFPVAKAEAFIEYYNIFNNQINYFEIHFPIQQRNSQLMTFQLESKFCGIINISTAEINIYDPLRIFKFRIGKNIGDDIVILPEGHSISACLGSCDMSSDESTAFSEHRAGDDPSEIFDLRGFVDGDKLNRVHWKLSSKSDELIVKDFGMPIDSRTALFLNLRCSENSEYTLPIYDTLIEALVSLSQFLIENERTHTIIYYSASESCFVQHRVDSGEALSEAVSELLVSLGDDLSFRPPEEFLPECGEKSFTSFTFITAEQDKKALDYIDREISSEIKNAVVVVKDEASAEIARDCCPSLSITPVVIGRISSSVKDIEL